MIEGINGLLSGWGSAVVEALFAPRKHAPAFAANPGSSAANCHRRRLGRPRWSAWQDNAEDRAEENRSPAPIPVATLEGLVDAFYVLDREWRFTYVNGEACRILRRRREDLLGRSIWEQFPQARDSRMGAMFDRALAECCTVELVDFNERLDLWFRMRACPCPHGLAVSFVDITAQKLAENQLMAMNAELEERVSKRTQELQVANREMEALSYAVAHDLRGPLSAVLAYSELLSLKHGHELSGPAPHYLQRIHGAAEQVIEMAEGLLSLARVSGADLQRERFDLTGVAAEIVATLRIQDPGRQARVDLLPNCWAHGDAVLLRQVLSNLIGNAWKFSAACAQTHIQFGMRMSDEGDAVYYVRDNGAGFDAARASKLFQPFRRLHSASEFKGTGVGLAIVRKIIDLHRGRVWAESSPGDGATFYFTLGGRQDGVVRSEDGRHPGRIPPADLGALRSR